ncbi:MAG: NAD-dependent deacylase [Gammaproteobacteria bacterium]|nr:NAD-dependent deacylase [Gammaproteobacteria bacterium]MDH5172543.1 NAD-dependent deacylase [Gammaproteobacteria bacterium]
MAQFNGRFIGSIVVLTGAGISAESGVPTFRDADGLWEQHDPMEIATPGAFRRNPDLVYRFYNARRSMLAAVAPNQAHQALARLQREFAGEVFLVTQNVDDLHERGGSSQVCHMHGQLQASLCTACRRSMHAHGDFDRHSSCPACGAVGCLRPDVVWFGEIPYYMDEIEARLAECDLFIAIGTSGLVYPAAGFVQRARGAGATTVELNREPSEVAGLFHHRRQGLATTTVSALVAELLAG